MKHAIALVLTVAVLCAATKASPTQDAGASSSMKDNDRTIVAAVYAHILDDYYRPTAPQTAVGGARAALLRLLEARGIEDPVVPAAFAVGDRARDEALVTEMVRNVRAAYPHAAASDEFRYAAVAGMADALGDPYTHYYTPGAMKSVAAAITGQFGGVGMSIRSDDAGRVVATPNAGSAAAEAGVRAGDVIEEIDGKGTTGRSIDDLADAVRGLPGTIVTLRIRHDATSDPITVHITRRLIEPHYVTSQEMGDVAYIRVAAFARNVPDDVNRALLDARAKGARGIILDLRNNSGGLSEAAVGLTSLLLPNGNVFTTLGRSGSREAHPVSHHPIYAGPLVTLVNSQTRSAAEITAGALQDAHRSVLVGTTTFGKGVAQRVLTLPDQSGLVLTEWRYLTRNGRDIDHKGLEPDVQIDQPADEAIILTPEDRQVAQAQALLHQRR